MGMFPATKKAPPGAPLFISLFCHARLDPGIQEPRAPHPLLPSQPRLDPRERGVGGFGLFFQPRGALHQFADALGAGLKGGEALARCTRPEKGGGGLHGDGEDHGQRHPAIKRPCRLFFRVCFLFHSAHLHRRPNMTSDEWLIVLMGAALACGPLLLVWTEERTRNKGIAVPTLFTIKGYQFSPHSVFSLVIGGMLVLLSWQMRGTSLGFLFVVFGFVGLAAAAGNIIRSKKRGA